MDIKKLEQLSCLKIDEKDHPKIKESITDIWSMLQNLPSIDVIQGKSHSNQIADYSMLLLKAENEDIHDSKKVVVLKKREEKEPSFTIEEKTNGLKYNEDGLFEVVRVVHKKD